MADRVPLHLTLAYPEEMVDEPLAVERLVDAARHVGPFDVELGEVWSDDGGRGGVFVAVGDPSGALEELRDAVLLPPMRWSGWPFHVTVAHPRTSPDPVACASALLGSRVDGRLRVDAVHHTVTDHVHRRVLHTVALQEPEDATVPVRMAGAVVVRDGRVLLGRRAASRALAPGVWDVVGGHVERGESARRALRRELREELGIDAVPVSHGVASSCRSSPPR